MNAPRRAVVTGSASGIGQATTQRLREAGWQVIGVDRDPADVTVDLATPAGREQLVRAVGEQVEALDAVVACAGTATAGAMDVSTNYFGAVATLTGLLPLLARGRQPRAVAVVSSAIALPYDEAIVSACLAGDEAAACEHTGGGLPGQPLPVYASTKVALARWIRRAALSRDWLGPGVLLNGIAPGTTVTNMTRPMLADPAIEPFIRHVAPCPIGRYAEPAELAEAIHFLASPGNSFMVGQTIYVDGGAEATLRGDGRY